MTFAELLDRVSWPDLKAALLWCYPDEKDSLERYRVLYGKLKEVEPQQSQMRIIVKETYRPRIDDEPFMEVIGRNRERNRDQADFKYIRESVEPGWADEEADYTLSYHRWAEWLGMIVDDSTLGTVPLPQIVAHCLSDMTFYGFEEEDAQAVLAEVKERAAKLDAMTSEQREKELIPHEEVIIKLKSQLEKE